MVDKKCSVDRMEFSIIHSSGKPVTRLKDDDKPLAFYEVKNKDTLTFKDLGLQINWRTVFVIEYIGPLILFPLFYYSKEQWNFTQR